MASIKAFLSDPPGLKKNEVSCSFCGSEAVTAGWSGALNVFTCHHCAVETLPKLMADAVVEDTDADKLNDIVEHELRNIKKRFKKAAFIAATTKRRGVS